MPGYLVLIGKIRFSNSRPSGRKEVARPSKYYGLAA
jgi:hypothetical protein